MLVRMILSGRVNGESAQQFNAALAAETGRAVRAIAQDERTVPNAESYIACSEGCFPQLKETADNLAAKGYPGLVVYMQLFVECTPMATAATPASDKPTGSDLDDRHVLGASQGDR